MQILKRALGGDSFAEPHNGLKRLKEDYGGPDTSLGSIQEAGSQGSKRVAYPVECRPHWPKYEAYRRLFIGEQVRILSEEGRQLVPPVRFLCVT